MRRAGTGRTRVEAMDGAGRWFKEDWFVVTSYAVLALLPFVLAATHAWFWEGEHSTAPVASGIAIAVLVALLFRKAWAWRLLVLVQAVALISFVFDFTSVLALALNLASFALLLSPQMRRFIRRG